jgi:hypothetical protein
MRGFRWLWPSIANPSDAENAVKIGAGAAMFLAILSCVLAVAAVMTERPQAGVDGWGMVDASLFALVAWRISERSFPWAIAGLALYLLEVLWGLITFTPGALGIVTVFIVLAFVGGVRGTYFLRNLKNAQPDLTAEARNDGDGDVPGGNGSGETANTA